MEENDNIRIELGQSVRRHIEHAVPPLEDKQLCAVSYDEAGADQVPVFILESVMRSIEQHAAGARDREVGGVLLGGFYRGDSGAFVKVTDFIEAKASEGTDVSVTFTHEAWEQITAEQSRRGPDAQIVGWYHTHPGLGVFMSREDEFIHSSYFGDPWNVALVVDPIYHNWGCFKWRDGALERTGGFYVYGERKAAKRIREYAKIMEEARRPAPRAASAAADRRGTDAQVPVMALWVVVAMLVIAQAVTGYLALRPAEPVDYYGQAIEALSKGDLTGGAALLRQELVERPGNENALKELRNLGRILSEPGSEEVANPALDAVNAALAAADRHAKTGLQPAAESTALGAEGNVQMSSYDPMPEAFRTYSEAEPSLRARLARAVCLENTAGRLGLKSDGPDWWHEAVTRPRRERFRRIAYGVQTGDEASKAAHKKLPKNEKATVNEILDELRGSR